MEDQRGLRFSSGSAGSRDAYEAALRAFNVYRGDPVAIIDKALAEDPDFAMGHVLRAEVHVSMWERGVLPEIEASLARLEELGNRLNERERMHAGAIRQWAAGDWNGMRDRLDRLSAEYPRDLLALQIGHLADFFHGDRHNLQGRVARALPAWNRDDPGYGILLGMRAFGLEENGDYAVAEETGRHALALDGDDCWAQHAVAHVLEMQGRQAEGAAFMESRTAHWAQDDNGFAFHNWWHTALYHLDQDHVGRVLEIYDQGVRPEPSDIHLMLLDAAALLWRLHLRGIDVGGRWQELADAYERTGDDGFYVFNDLHRMMALVATGRNDAAQRLLDAVTRAAGEAGTNARMVRDAGHAVVAAIEAFGRERYGDAVDLLMPVRYRAYVFGGSNAQRDILHRTLIEAALRAGDRPLAIALANERTVGRPHCPFSRSLAARAVALH
ncbi:tetratricopeptide repeat protein [Oceanibacterium hippocampi]|uniref:Tetratricopeptide repeat protein 38 n=1 Tax=Oceanibacterium hippocampi TaxID=745714 RepID=A0A1Y5RZR5_9PROT|nr:tetratricopeptide repeat protein [Oceanibacterium hippocampi]SLN26339.1 hypothetical protein OCH7691_00809 [Oceanibacterium hippocampi]